MPEQKNEHIEESNELRKLASEYKLKAPNEYWSAPIDVLANAYNGIGPDRWPNIAREALDKILPFALPATEIHDWMYTYSDGSKFYYDKANTWFYENLKTTIANEFPLYNPLNWLKRKLLNDLAYIMYKAVDDKGWEGYDAAYKKLQSLKNIPMKPKIV